MLYRQWSFASVQSQRAKPVCQMSDAERMYQVAQKTKVITQHV